MAWNRGVRVPQQRLANLIAMAEFIEVPIFILEVRDERDLIFRSLNRFHQTVSGMDGKAIVGKRPHEILPPRMADSVSAKYMTCVRTRAPFTYEEVLDFPNGEIWWQTTLSPILFDDGSVIGIYGLSVDITARKQQEFRDAKELTDLRKLNEEINMYSSMAAHDVRGPLRKIKVISELLFADDDTPPTDPLVLPPEQRELMHSIGAIANSTLDHVDSILSYSRALSLPDAATLEKVDLRLLIADLVGLVDASGAFDFVYPDQTVLAERIILQVTLRNLLENAVKFGRSKCTVTLETSADDPQFLQFVASDDGPGFAEGAVLLEQSAQSLKKSPTSGFGLASAQRMVEARGGRMWLMEDQTTPGAHVAFTMRGSIVADAA